jgi:hypothetical protein
MPDENIKISSLNTSATETTSADKKEVLNFDLNKLFSGTKSGIKKIQRLPDWFKLVKYIYPLTIIVVIIFLSLLMTFLYNNVYLIMTQVAIVGNLKAHVIEERLSIENFNGVVSKLTEKKNLSLWRGANQLSSPFVYGKRNSSAPATSTVPASSTTPTTTPIR